MERNNETNRKILNSNHESCINNVNAVNNYSTTSIIGVDSLKQAINIKDYVKITSIINQYTSENINKPYCDGETIMSILIENMINNENIFNLLFSKKAYIESLYVKGKNIYMLRKNDGLLNSIILNGFYYKEKKKVYYVDKPVIYYTKLNIISMISKLIRKGASSEESDSNGYTPIYYAIKNQNLDMVKLFIKKIDINKTNNFNQTPLAYAMELSKKKSYNNNNMKDIIVQLESVGSTKKLNTLKINKKMLNGNISVILEKIGSALNEKNYNEIITILKESSTNGSNEIFNEGIAMDIIINNKVNSKEIFDFITKNMGCIKNSYFSKKHIKLINNNLGLIKSIIENGFYVKVKKKIEYINTPLIFFINHNMNDTINILLNNNVSIEETDEIGNTPIFYAIKLNKFELFHSLIYDYHADITRKNKNGETPLMYAMIAVILLILIVIIITLLILI